MKIKWPSISKPGDLLKFLENMPGQNVPEGPVEAAAIKRMGYSAASSNSLAGILKFLGFAGEDGHPAALWSEFVASEDRAGLLAKVISRAYAGLFKDVMYPYLADDEIVLEYINAYVEATPKEMEQGLATFRALCSLADFQDVPEEYESVENFKEVQPSIEDYIPDFPSVTVDPNVQMNIQIHIDANTPDEKIETIFKAMRKYLLAKE